MGVYLVLVVNLALWHEQTIKLVQFGGYLGFFVNTSVSSKNMWTTSNPKDLGQGGDDSNACSLKQVKFQPQ